MAFKLFAANFKKYRLDKYLESNKVIDWRQNRKVEIGDYIFMYVSHPFSAIKYLFKVVDKDIPFEKSIDDSKYWQDPEEYKECAHKLFLRLELLDEFNVSSLSLENLLNHGLVAAPQGGMKLEGELLDYVLSASGCTLPKEERIARICWNTNFWRYPSGEDGKSKTAGVYEAKYGFGHEEWLLDDSKLIDGYHYSFLQQLFRDSAPFEGSIRLHLFTKRKGEGKLYLGYIDNFEYVSKERSREITQIYRKNGWLKDMVESVKQVDGDSSVFKGHDLTLFNCRFRFSDVHVNLSNMQSISEEDINTRGERYGVLMKKKGDFKFIGEYDFFSHFPGLTCDRSENSIERKTCYAKTKYDPIHKKMQNRIRKILLGSGIYSQVKLEVDRVDIVGLTKTNKFHFFEVKTYAAKQSIREALGQILEYNHYPDKSYAEKMVIICPFPLEDDDRKYLRNLRALYGFKLYFRYYSLEYNELGQEE